MKTLSKENRREFLKTASIGAAGLIVSSMNPGCSQTSSSSSASAWTPDKKINPHIDNLRVVCCHDPAMITGDPKKWDMAGQNATVNKVRVSKDLDEMAKTLASKESSTEAWKTIFQKPATKEWKDLHVAIKVNCIYENHPRIAIVAKICDEFHSLGIPYKYITIYDGCHDADKFYTSYIGKGIPAGVVVSKKNKALGGKVKTIIPKPYPGKFECTKSIANGIIDILVNIAVNKGHNSSLGKTTLTMKNHAGTFEPGPIHKGGGLNYIIALNKSNAILGGTPPRQQLCIVDSIWAMTGGPQGKPNKKLCRLIMGTFSPAVDYLTVKKIREPLLGANHKHIDRFLKDFGYSDFKKLNLISVNPPA